MPFAYGTFGLDRKIPAEKRARISQFLDFLDDGGSKQSGSDEEIAALQSWVIQTLAKRMLSEKNPSIATRRDLGPIAALCAAPARGTPRKWPENSLKIEGREVLLWDVAMEEPCFALPLRFWHGWRQRMPRRTNGGSTAISPNQGSFSPAQTAPLEPGPAQRSAATQLDRRAQQHRAHHSGEDQSRFPLEGSSPSETDPALAQTPRAFRVALSRV